MDARALICEQGPRVELREVELAEPGPGHVVIRAIASGVSPGTELALMRARISWGPFPLCTGYQAVGQVTAVGQAVTGFAVGDRVYYRDNNTGMRLADGREISAVTGAHASHAVVDVQRTHGLAQLPAEAEQAVGLAAASLYVLPAVGLNGVDMANPRLGQSVVVYGAGLVGLAVVAACAHRGCRVIAVDLDTHRLRVARQLGAEHAIDAKQADVHAAVRELAPAMADVVFECTGLPELLDPAIALCRSHGTFVWQGNYGADPVRLGFLPAHGRRLTMFFPCDDGGPACRAAVLANMARGALPWHRTVTHEVNPPAAAELLNRMLRGAAADVLGAVVRWDH